MICPRCETRAELLDSLAEVQRRLTFTKAQFAGLIKERDRLQNHLRSLMVVGGVAEVDVRLDLGDGEHEVGVRDDRGGPGETGTAPRRAKRSG